MKASKRHRNSVDSGGNAELPKCGLCGRPMVEGPSLNRHHLVPKSLGGTRVVAIHRICHSKVHSVFTERELAAYFHTFERLLEHEEIRAFVRWVRKQPPEFDARHDRKRRR